MICNTNGGKTGIQYIPSKSYKAKGSVNKKRITHFEVKFTLSCISVITVYKVKFIFSTSLYTCISVGPIFIKLDMNDS